jgi:hypothetical protein
MLMLSLLCNRARRESIHRCDHFLLVKCDYTNKGVISGLLEVSFVSLEKVFINQRCLVSSEMKNTWPYKGKSREEGSLCNMKTISSGHM